MSRMVCRIFGHRWVFSHITIPRQVFCASCGKKGRSQ